MNNTTLMNCYKKAIQCVAMMAVALVLLPASQSRAGDIMDVNFSTIQDQRLRDAFSGAEQFWESTLHGIRADLPRSLAANWNKLQITAIEFDIDGAGMTVADAQVTDTIRIGGGGLPGLPGGFGGNFPGAGRPWELAQAALMRFDVSDTPFLSNDELLSTVIHEMGHALGFATLWEQNELLADQPTGFREYVGEWGVHRYQRVRQDLTLAFVPLEKQGGAGTAGGHWDSLDPAFTDATGAAAIMTGFVSPASFLSAITEEAMYDLGYANRFHPRAWDDGVRGGFPDKWTIGVPPFSFRPPPRGVPEPSSIAILAGLSLVAAVRRKRK